ncbi:fibrobacter succinogenes major paralogous domain-containing protein [Flavobacterium sp. XGLA_31]|uniref:fibrobacter succinogenes major paralogous domain-containing protein n=1 Tax=Flavobacterium sp. XGLA_31 TaxID=3447666 RepID=UPI003F2D8840
MKYIKSLLLLLTVISLSNCSTSSSDEGGNIVINPTIGSVVTYDVSDLTIHSVSSGGNVSSDGGSPITARGVVWNVHPNPTIALNTKTTDGAGLGSFDSAVTELESNTTYYLRAYATNEYGTAYGNQVTFTTPINPDDLPIVITKEPTQITTNTALSGGIVSSVGASPVSARGVVWSTTSMPTINNTGITVNGANLGEFDSNITNLLPNTVYYVRAYATNLHGTGYGEEYTFTTSPLLYSVGGGVTDVDGVPYNTVIINGQEWTTRNLNVTRYTDGTVIPQVQDAAAWTALTTGAWCYYAFQTSNGVVYSKMYNWYAVAGIWNAASATNASLRKTFAPAGWHVSSTADWTSLATFLGGMSEAGAFIKETGTTHWQTPNTGATNSTGLTALPSGSCLPNGTFSGIGTTGNWWCSDEYNSASSWCAGLVNSSTTLTKAPINKKYGFAIRLVKN